jgi:hypothetical protein
MLGLTYGHLLPDAREETTDALDRVFGPVRTALNAQAKGLER